MWRDCHVRVFDFVSFGSFHSLRTFDSVCHERPAELAGSRMAGHSGLEPFAVFVSLFELIMILPDLS